MENQLHYIMNHMRAAFKVLDKEWQMAAKDLGITQAEQHILWIVYLEKSITLTKLAELSLLDISTVAQVLTRMTKKDLIIQTKKNQDRRVTYVSLSPEGEKILHTSSTYEYQFWNYMKEMDPDKRAQFMSIVSDMNKHFYGDSFVKWVEKTSKKSIAD
ncbi:MarR family winged helix-turn-helix transcriptional regulator [Pseudalkalibacillus hwajinpoensis]|uniref:MarR family winged helix-turn-helix transcriptional regulator n=1 Tax=Guptibacillus hwajinpoensis TaxID=208199 RepID=UPI001CD22EBD|nr:MarR family transcriptional regulator [Pseudalkalibacillus hwajinpoensis]MCA0993464.1 MarR family transcriptional regulator [Pseudalkalibacillus hwajinpoensis]